MECKIGSQDTPGLTGKFGLGEKNEAVQRLTEFCQQNGLVITNTLFFFLNNKRYDFTDEHQQTINTKIKLITFFVAKDRAAVYSEQEQDLELTVAEIISFSQQNSRLN